MNQQQQIRPQFAFEGGHMVMFHQEATGLPQVKDATVNDRDRMQDLLAQEKYLTTAYSVAMNEACQDQFWQVMKQNFDTCQQLQRQLFQLMFKKGWYKLPVADVQALQATLQQFQQYQTQLPFPSGQQGQGVQSPAGGVQAQSGGGTPPWAGQGSVKVQTPSWPVTPGSH